MVSSLVSALLAVVLGAQTECSVLYFQSAQCAPCRQFEPVLNRLVQQGWDVRKIEAPAQLELAKQFQIKNLPTVVIMSGQREVDRLVGVVSFEQLQSRLSRVAARSRSASAQTQPQRPASRATIAGAPRADQLTATQPIATQPIATQPIATQPIATQPIVRGQSPSSDVPGQAFPLLAANTASGRPLAANVSAETNLGNADFAAHQARTQPPVQLASATRSTPGLNGLSAASPKMDRAPQVTLDRAIARATDATVRIKVEESNTIAHGTGTIVAVHGDEALVLTCGHLFRDMLPGSRLTLDLFAGTPRQVNLVAQLLDFKANEEDIALLSVQLPVKLEPVPILPRGEAVQKGQGVFTIGCDHGNNPSRHDTKISNVNRYLGAANIEIVGAPAVGRSGGGLFDTQGRLLGVCNAACQEDNEGIYAGIDVVYQQLMRIGQAHLFEDAGSASSTTASSVGQVSLASSATPVGPPSSNPSVPATKNSTRWPDEDPRLDVSQNASPSQGLELISSELTPSASSGSLVCVLRDASGQEKVLTIPNPSPALLQAIEQQGVVAR